jgi:(2Fe-2S) ferredoxin
VEKPKYHIFVCGSFRVSGEPQGMCHKKGSLQFIPYIEEGLRDRDIDGAMISMTGCLKVCDRGPAVVIYPQNWWYGNISGEDALDEILDALAEGKPAEKYLIA